MHQRKYFTSNFFINEIFYVEKFLNYGITQLTGTVHTETQRPSIQIALPYVVQYLIL